MKGLPRLLLLILLTLIGGFGAGCAPESPGPQQIATYPQSPGGDWYLPLQPDPGHLVYDAYMALEVWDPERSAVEAQRIAEDLGGYLVNSYTSYSDGSATITLELRIPPYNFEAARRSFRNLGALVRETVTGEWESQRSDWAQYAQFTLFLQRQGAPFSWGPIAGWRPVETFRQALQISGRILGFVVDLVIWVVVILGPFALIGWGIGWLHRRLQPSARTHSEDLEKASSPEGTEIIETGGPSHE